MSVVDLATTSAPARRAVNVFAMTASNVLGTLIGLAISIYVRRVLGPAAIGQVNWNLALLSYLALIANPGLQIMGAIELAQRPGETPRIASLVLTLQLIFSVIGYGVVLGVAALGLRGPAIGFLLLWQGLSLFVTAVNLDWALRAHERMVVCSIVSLVVNLLQLPILMILVRGPADVMIYAVAALPCLLLGAAFNFWYMRRLGYLGLASLAPTLTGWRDLMSKAWPLAASQFAIMICWNSGSVILGFTDGDRAVGIYSTATRLVFMTTIVSGAMFNAYLPILSRLKADAAEAPRVAGEFLSLMAWLGLAGTALGWACGQHLVDLLFGAQFHDSGPYFRWLCLNVGLIFVNIGVGLPLQAWGHQRRLLTVNLVAAGLNIALTLALLPRFGAWGAVAAAVGAEALVFGLQIRLRRQIGFGWHSILPVLAAPLLCSAGVAALIALFPDFRERNWWAETGGAAIALLALAAVFEPRAAPAFRRRLRMSLGALFPRLYRPGG